MLYANAKLGGIRSINLDPNEDDYEPIPPIEGMKRPVAFDFSVSGAKKYVYYSDESRHTIGRAEISGSERNNDFITRGM